MAKKRKTDEWGMPIEGPLIDLNVLEKPQKGSILDLAENPKEGSIMDSLLGNVDSSDSQHGGKPRKPISVGLQKKLIARARGECENCGIGLYNRKIDIHHKNYEPTDNRETNLIVLCKDCHKKLTGPAPKRNF